jgi:glycosyltransferase involved in cell wall biosynthesis
MKILYIVQHFNTPLGSAGLRPYMMAKELVNSGHEVLLACGSYSSGNTGLSNDFINGNRVGLVDGINVIEFDIPYSNNRSFLSRAFLFLKFSYKTILLSMTEDYDLIFSSSTPLTVSLPGIFARWIRKKVFVFEVRDLWPELPKAMGVIKNPIVLALISLLEYVSYKSANRLIGLSSGIVEGIMKRGVVESKVVCIPNGCDLDIFNTKTGESTFIPEGVDKADLVCIYTGTHGIANGLDSILNVANELLKLSVLNIKFILIGNGKLKNTLINKSKIMQLSNVYFLDSINKNDLAILLNNCDVGLQILSNIPAFYNGTSPNKFFDYIAASMPVLCNYPGWVSELINESECGISVLPDDPLDFAHKLIYLNDNRNLLPKMSNEALNLAKKSFDRNILAKKWVSWVVSGIK